MPKITDEHRAHRRAQILDAAWRCFYRNGVQPTTMEEIIAESGLSASAMYRYFSGKEDIIHTAIGVSLQGLTAGLQPLFADATLGPAAFVGRLLSDIERFAARPGFNLLPIGVHGWSEAQRDERVRGLIAGYYGQFRRMLVARVEDWKRTGDIDPDIAPADAAEALQSLILGYIVQTTITRDVSADAHARAVRALIPDFSSRPRPKQRIQRRR